MAQINLTLSQEEILDLLANGNREQAFSNLLQAALNTILQAESAEQLGAKPYERSDERKGYRNGIRKRMLKTRIGSIILDVPKHRGVPFETMIFDNYARSESALILTMAEMVVNGVSTRKVTKVMETLCDTPFSKSTVSKVCKDLDKEVEEFRNRPLNDSYPFLSIDATYFKVRENHRITSIPIFVAVATNEEGRKEIVGFCTCQNESKKTWTEFLKLLRSRGLKNVKLVVSDAHEGIIYAVRKIFPEAAWQRCQFHFSKNVGEAAPAKYEKAIHAAMNEMFNCHTIEEARRKRDEILEEYQDVASEAMKCLENGFEDAMTVMTLPRGLQRYYRTNNHIERLNKELKRRSDVIGVFPNEQSLLRLMGAVLIEQNDRLQTKRAVFSAKTYAELENSEVPKALREIAASQEALLKA